MCNGPVVKGIMASWKECFVFITITNMEKKLAARWSDMQIILRSFFFFPESFKRVLHRKWHNEVHVFKTLLLLRSEELILCARYASVIGSSNKFCLPCATNFCSHWIAITSHTGIGEGSDNLFQYSCLENSMNRGAWQATVHGVAETPTWLSN